jgi:hypothetical protein
MTIFLLKEIFVNPGFMRVNTKDLNLAMTILVHCSHLGGAAFGKPLL